MSYIDNADWYVVREGDHVSFTSRGDTDESIWGPFDIPIDVFDAVVLMRYAQLREDLEGMLTKRLAACNRYQSLGSEALRRWAGVPSLLEEIIRDVD